MIRAALSALYWLVVGPVDADALVLRGDALPAALALECRDDLARLEQSVQQWRAAL